MLVQAVFKGLRSNRLAQRILMIAIGGTIGHVLVSARQQTKDIMQARTEAFNEGLTEGANQGGTLVLQAMDKVLQQHPINGDAIAHEVVSSLREKGVVIT